jgi:ferric-dicitrate binding protein FerR (iron transport regulator)
MNLKPKQYFIQLLNKLFDDSITNKELEKLSHFFLNNQELLNWPQHFGSKIEIEARIFNKIQSDINSGLLKENKIIPLYKKYLFKYAVASSVVLLISLTYILNRDNTSITTNPILVNTNIIEPGKDKATLTLEDGSIVALEKGNTYQIQNASSNGEKLVYDSGAKTSKKIVYNYLTVPRGGQFHIILSDGTQVWLNSESQLKYPVLFNEEDSRKVELVYGEAYFDVSPSSEHKGLKFKVFNQSQEVEVFGTEFNIKAYKDDTKIYTTLVEGKVTVNIGNLKQSLLPSQQLSLNRKTNNTTVNYVDVFNEVSWKDGVFSFENIPLKEMMKVLSRWYDVEVLFKNKSIENEQFVGVLRKSQNLEEILLSIENFKIIKNHEIKDKKVILE